MQLHKALCSLPNRHVILPRVKLGADTQLRQRQTGSGKKAFYSRTSDYQVMCRKTNLSKTHIMASLCNIKWCRQSDSV